MLFFTVQIKCKKKKWLYNNKSSDNSIIVVIQLHCKKQTLKWNKTSCANITVHVNCKFFGWFVFLQSKKKNICHKCIVLRIRFEKTSCQLSSQMFPLQMQFKVD